MSDNNNKTPPHIRIPRSLLSHPTVRGMTDIQFRMLIYILENAAYTKHEMDDHGISVILEPGQFMFTYRDLANEFGTSKGAIERFLARLKSGKIAGHKQGHTKTILTFTHSDTCEIFKRQPGTQTGTSGGQVEDIKEEREKEKKVNIKEKETKENAAKAAPSFLAASHELVTKIIFCIKGVKPDYVEPKNLNPWLTQANLMIKNDNREPQKILDVLNWAFSDKWYCPKMFKSNAVKYLRDNFDEMEMSMQTSSKHSPSRANLGGKRQTEYDNAY